jgi:DMSO/TMAO reductase YedYZ molybdopterin-dependent catalytic subunit
MSSWLKDMFSMDQSKTQPDSVPVASEAPEGVMIRPDTRRQPRLPPGQSRTKKWPVLDAGGAPPIDLSRWTLPVKGLVARPVGWIWPSFLELPRVRVFSGFHCVTRWSRAGGWSGDARFVLVTGYDSSWTTNLPVEDFLAEDALVGVSHDGEALSAEHGGPARLIVPRLYSDDRYGW